MAMTPTEECPNLGSFEKILGGYWPEGIHPSIFYFLTHVPGTCSEPSTGVGGGYTIK